MPLTNDEEIAQYEKSRAFLPRGPSYSMRPAIQVSPDPSVGPTIKAAGSKRKLTQYQKAFQGAINRSRAWKAKTGGVSMTQGEVDSRRGQGGGYALPGGQAVKMGPDIQHGRYATVPDPVNPAGRLVPMGPPAFDSQVERQREAQQAPGTREGTPQTGMKITTPYGMVESTPPVAPLASPSALSPAPAGHSAPFPVMGGTRGAVVNQALRQPAPLTMANPWGEQPSGAPVGSPALTGTRGTVVNEVLEPFRTPNTTYSFPESVQGDGGYNQPLPSADWVPPIIPGGSGKKKRKKPNATERALAPLAAAIRKLTGLKKSKASR